MRRLNHVPQAPLLWVNRETVARQSGTERLPEGDRMPPRRKPTRRQMRLGSELRKLREAAGMAAREAGALLGGNQAQISHIESGRWGVSAERVRRLAQIYSVTDRKLIAALCEMAEDRGKGWWEQYRGILAPEFLDIAELEHHAVSLRCVQALTVPGILQTENYARSIFRQVIPELDGDEVEARVAHRMGRRAIFSRKKPTSFDAIVHEATLRMRYGGRTVAQGQLAYLREASDWPSVTIRIIPFATDGFIGSAQAMLYASGTIPQLDTVQLDGSYGAAYLDAKAQLDKYKAIYRALDGIALNANESREIIARIAQEL
jgi:transcriptional regulator with XRE-family HTH domain